MWKSVFHFSKLVVCACVCVGGGGVKRVWRYPRREERNATSLNAGNGDYVLKKNNVLLAYFAQYSYKLMIIYTIMSHYKVLCVHVSLNDVFIVPMCQYTVELYVCVII